MALTTKKGHKETALTPNILSLPLLFTCWWHSATQSASLGPLTTQSQQSTRNRWLEGQCFNQGSECLSVSPLPWPHIGLIGSWRRSSIFASAAALPQKALLAFQGLADVREAKREGKPKRKGHEEEGNSWEYQWGLRPWEAKGKAGRGHEGRGVREWKSLCGVRLFATPWTVQSTEFSRPEYWKG